MIDLLGLVMITSVDITAFDHLQSKAVDYSKNEYDVSEHYTKSPTLYLGGYVPLTDTLKVTFNTNTGIYTKAMNVTGSGSLGLNYTTKLKDPSWGLSTSISWSRSADVSHSSCTHGDKYNREFTCGIGGTISPILHEDVTGKWSKPTIQVTLTHRF